MYLIKNKVKRRILRLFETELGTILKKFEDLRFADEKYKFADLQFADFKIKVCLSTSAGWQENCSVIWCLSRQCVTR